MLEKKTPAIPAHNEQGKVGKVAGSPPSVVDSVPSSTMKALIRWLRCVYWFASRIGCLMNA